MTLRSTLLCLVLTTAIDASTPRIAFDVSSTTLNAPGSIVLSWSVRDSRSVYISDVGGVPPKGERRVPVSAGTTFWLVAEGDTGVASKQVTIRVKGTKGTDTTTRIDYVKQIDDRLASRDLAAALDELHRLLQDSLKFSVSGPYADENATVLKTDLVESADLVNASEQAIGARRVAYMLRIFPGREGQYNYSISTAIQYRRKIERTWYWEATDSRLHRQAADSLRARINSRRPMQ